MSELERLRSENERLRRLDAQRVIGRESINVGAANG